MQTSIYKIREKKVKSSFKYNIWSADFADMKLVSKSNKGFQFLLYVIEIYSKYSWVISLKDRKKITITKVFKKKLVELKQKPNKL